MTKGVAYQRNLTGEKENYQPKLPPTYCGPDPFFLRIVGVIIARRSAASEVPCCRNRRSRRQRIERGAAFAPEEKEVSGRGCLRRLPGTSSSLPEEMKSPELAGLLSAATRLRRI
ncbi:unnamed protein product [Cuscuta europaea]|uniref:Uncharacterized protein n=1 Tax=Cuscuta europaea TaxID=41803 RepID=A0A9P0YJD4_CUSEU|nr:unnamed protein product [Cuscuta europaea]